MRVLVTGATGYIGTSIVRALATGGDYDVTALVRDVTSHRSRALSALGANLVEAEVGDVRRLVPAIASVSAVVHTAWDADDPVTTDIQLFDAMITANRDGQPRHLLQTSGCSIYGRHEHPVLQLHTSVDPSTPRGRIELELKESGLAHTVLRPGMVYGGDYRSSFVAGWLRQMRTGSVQLQGRQDRVWSWVHVDDVAAAFSAVLREPAVHDGQVYLLADHHRVRPHDILTYAADLMGLPSAVETADPADEVDDYRVFDRDEVIDPSHAVERLGWSPDPGGVLADLPHAVRLATTERSDG